MSLLQSCLNLREQLISSLYIARQQNRAGTASEELWEGKSLPVPQVGGVWRKPERVDVLNPSSAL